jgi:dolichol-phosphate mannosyltransferase
MLDVPGERFEYEMNMLITASGRHIDFQPVAIQTIYIEENRRTHFRPFQDSMQIYIQLFKNFFKYASASGLSTVLDITLFTLLDKWLLPLTGISPVQTVLWRISLQVLLATAVARAVSAFFNYKVNKSFVFQIEKSRGSLTRYLFLAVLVMATSAGLVSGLHNWLGMDKTLLKAIVDTLLFFINYRLQRSWVFTDRSMERKGTL